MPCISPLNQLNDIFLGYQWEVGEVNMKYNTPFSHIYKLNPKPMPKESFHKFSEHWITLWWKKISQIKSRMSGQTLPSM